jgi:hypothetical protein
MLWAKRLLVMIKDIFRAWGLVAGLGLLMPVRD